MKLEQQTQILLPTKIKKRKTIPPELLVDIFKTINTYPYELSRGLWKMYAEKLMTSSSIVYLSAGNAFRQCKKKIMSSSKNISFGEESKPIDMFSADEKQAIEILKNNDYSEDPSTNAYWALKFMNVLGAKRTLEKTNESYLSQIVALKSQIFLHEIQKSKLEKGLVASPGSVTGKSTGTPTGTGIVSPTGIKQSTSTSSVVNIVDQVCAVCETNPIKHLYKDHWICGSCYTRPIKLHAPCSNNGECKTYQLLKCPPCRLKKFSQLGIVKSPSKPESKKEEGSNERKRKLAELTGENPDIVCEDTPPQ